MNYSKSLIEWLLCYSLDINVSYHSYRHSSTGFCSFEHINEHSQSFFILILIIFVAHQEHGQNIVNIFVAVKVTVHLHYANLTHVPVLTSLSICECLWSLPLLTVCLRRWLEGVGPAWLDREELGWHSDPVLAPSLAWALPLISCHSHNTDFSLVENYHMTWIMASDRPLDNTEPHWSGIYAHTLSETARDRFSCWLGC